MSRNFNVMTTEERIKKQKELVESMGRLYDKQGQQAITGRILGLLTVMDKEIYTFDEIVEELQVSKSSVSNSLRILEIRDFIEYTTIPGDRKRFFHIKKQDKYAIVRDHKTKLTQSRNFMQSVLDLKADKTSENSLFIGNILDMLNFFLQKFDELQDEYESGK